MTKNKIVSRWGDPELDDSQYVTIPGFILRHYSKFEHDGQAVGLTSDEFQVFAHIMSFKYDVAGAEAAPSLQTVADQTGKHISSIRRTVKRMTTKQALAIEHRPGKPSAYNFGELVRQCRAFEVAANASTSADARTSTSADASTPLAQTLAEDLDLENNKKNVGAKTPRKRSTKQMALDDMVETLIGTLGLNRDKITKALWSELRGAGRQLLEAHATPEEMPQLYAWCSQQKWNGTWGAHAMAKNYANWDKTRKVAPMGETISQSQKTRAALYEEAS